MSLMARKPSIHPSVLFPHPPLSNPELDKCSTTEVHPQLTQNWFIGLVPGEMFAIIHTGTHSMDPFWHRCYVLLKWESKRDTIIFRRIFACFCLMSFKSSFKPVSWETLCSCLSQAQITPSFTLWTLRLRIKRKASPLQSGSIFPQKGGINLVWKPEWPNGMRDLWNSTFSVIVKHSCQIS